MSSRHLADWCPHHRVLGPAELPDHRLALLRRSIRWGAGVADVVADPGHSVWGVVYELPLGLAELDAKEAAGTSYRRREFEVLLAGEPIRVQAYEVITKEPADVVPRRDYMELLVAGALEHGLPGHYVAELRALLPTGP
jgi:gamma-glutamylcyclotransferase